MADQSFAKKLQKRIVVYSAAGMILVGCVVALSGIVPLSVELREAQQKNLNVYLRRQTRATEQYVVRAQTASTFRFARGRMREELDRFAARQLPLPEFLRAATNALREAVSTSTNTIALYLLDRRTNILVQCGQTIPPALWTVPDAGIQDTALRGPVRVGAEYCMISGSTVRSSQGERLGYAMALYRLHSLKFVVEDYSDLGHTGETILGDLSNPELPIFFPFRPLRASVAADTNKLAALRTALTYAQQGRTGILPQTAGDTGLVLAYGPVEGVPWGIVVKMDRDEFFGPINRRLAGLGAVIFGVVLLGTAGMVFVLRPLAGRVILHTDELESQIYEKN